MFKIHKILCGFVYIDGGISQKINKQHPKLM